MKNKKCIVMFSGGLDSRLAIKIMQEQGFRVIAVFFKLPFGTGCCSEGCSFNFSQLHGVELKIFDCTKGKLLQEYLEIVKKPRFNRGSSFNPCIDCRIFIFKKTKEFADKEKISLIVSGEVLGERPMSQHKKAMRIIEEESGLKDRLLRPLSAKLLEESIFEKNSFVNREKLYGIQGRKRDQQIALAKKFNIHYPGPAGGCLLCDKNLKARFKHLLKRGINDSEINFVGIGRHFLIDGSWVVIGRNQLENKLIESLDGAIISDYPAPSAIILDNSSEKIIKKVKKLVLAYSKKGSLSDRANFEIYKI